MLYGRSSIFEVAHAHPVDASQMDPRRRARLAAKRARRVPRRELDAIARTVGGSLYDDLTPAERAYHDVMATLPRCVHGIPGSIDCKHVPGSDTPLGTEPTTE